ncbi:hypothetical protein VN12_12085 [Pirellula sp. SH-Sr6A]|nr:hypothetical protein VN12_12085 [Pirellula sp. SH-Sr6A]
MDGARGQHGSPQSVAATPNVQAIGEPILSSPLRWDVFGYG